MLDRRESTVGCMSEQMRCRLLVGFLTSALVMSCAVTTCTSSCGAPLLNRALISGFFFFLPLPLATFCGLLRPHALFSGEIQVAGFTALSSSRARSIARTKGTGFHVTHVQHRVGKVLENSRTLNETLGAFFFPTNTGCPRFFSTRNWLVKRRKRSPAASPPSPLRRWRCHCPPSLQVCPPRRPASRLENSSQQVVGRSSS